MPDCTVDVTVAEALKLDVVYRCRSTQALTFEPDDQELPRTSRAIAAPGRAGQRHGRGALPLRPRRLCARRQLAAEGIQRGEAVLAPIPGLAARAARLPAPADDRHPRSTPDGFVFATGLPKVGDAWRLAGTRVRFAGYTAIGRFKLHELAVPAPGSLRAGAAKEDGVLRLAMLDGFAEASTPDLVDWVQRTAQAEANYWQGFTAKQMLVGLVPIARARRRLSAAPCRAAAPPS